MILKYGSYAHDQNEVNVEISRTQIMTEGSQGAGYKETWRIQGVKHAANQADLTTALAALDYAYFFNGQDLTIYLDDGVTLTNHRLQNSRATGGIKVVKPVSYPTSEGAEYCTYRSYEIIVEAEFRVDSNNPLDDAQTDSWHETLSFQGTGGPLFSYLRTINGPWQKQQTSDRSNYIVIQRGQAIGRNRHPTPRGPIWPEAEHVEQRVIDKQSADRNGSQLVNFPISWTYVFESDQALIGEPSPFPQ